MPAHGGPDAAGVPLHDFSTNANAAGPCPAALAAVQQADAVRYPDPQYTALRAALAAFHGVAASRIVLAASASEFIMRITAAVTHGGGRTVCVPRHAYGDYAQASSAWRLVAAPAEQAALVWCCEPSSPLGGQAHAPLAETIDALAPGATCVLDLAYEPLRLQGALGINPAQRDRVWQLWTPNKALGLTGVRAAYAIAPASTAGAAMAQAMLELAPSWPVGAHGVALLHSWVTPGTQTWLAASRNVLRAWKAHQIALCAFVLGWACEPSTANFFCARPTDTDVAPLCSAVRGHGIKLRDAASFGLPGHVRLAVMPGAAQAALVAAVAAAAAGAR